MSQQEANPDDLGNDDQLTPEELFEQAVNPIEDKPNELGPDEPVDYSRQPEDDDSDEYVKGFAESKGWKDDPTSVKNGFWTDYRAFVNTHKRIQESKAVKHDNSEIKNQIDQLVKGQVKLMESTEQRHAKELAAQRAELEGKVSAAEELDDLDSFKKADKDLREFDEAVKPKVVESAPVPTGEKPFYTEFRTANPELLEGSEVFDPLLNTLVTNSVNSKLQAFVTKYNQAPPEEDIRGYLAEAITESKSGLVKYQAAPARTAPSTAKAKSAPTKTADPSMLTGNYRGMYDHLMENNQKAAAAEFLSKYAAENKS